MRPRPLWRRPAGPDSNLARRDPALAACSCRIAVGRHRGGIGRAGGRLRLSLATMPGAGPARLLPRSRRRSEHWCLAVDRVRYVGEPVAVALARDRYTAEDALEQIAVSYRPLPAVIDPVAAAESAAPVLHPALGCNVVSDRQFRYGDPEAAFAAAAHRIAITSAYPRNSGTPIECFVVIAEYLPGEDGYEITANFQGPFAMHPVMALALGVPANRLRLKTPPDSGGSFGAKHAVFPYIVLMALAARKAGRPVKWVENRIEHLVAARPRRPTG